MATYNKLVDHRAQVKLFLQNDRIVYLICRMFKKNLTTITYANFIIFIGIKSDKSSTNFTRPIKRVGYKLNPHTQSHTISLSPFDRP